MIGAEELKRFEKDLKENEDLRKKYDDAISHLNLTELHSDSDLIAKAANTLGYSFSAADVERASAGVQELDMNEMQMISGGAKNPKYKSYDSGVCMSNFVCVGCYEKKSIDGDGHNEWCYASWHCYTAFLHTNSSDDKEAACWSNYTCFVVNKDESLKYD